MNRTAPLLTLLAALALALQGCISIRLGGDDSDSLFRMDGLGTAYADIVGFDDYDGPILGIDVLRNLGRGEVASVDVGPILGVGVGIAGARVRVFPFEIGVGTLFYRPRPTRKSEPVESADERRTRRERERREQDEGREPRHDDDRDRRSDDRDANRDDREAGARTGRERSGSE